MGRARKISREDVLEVAFAQIVEGGIDSISMRGLGHRLGVEAMTLYGYVGSKSELLESLRVELFREVPTQVDTGRPRRDLEEMCLGAWRVLTKRPGAHALLADMNWSLDEMNVSGDNSPRMNRHEDGRAVATWLPLAEAMLRPLRSLIPEALDRAYAFRVLFRYVLGQVMLAESTFCASSAGRRGAPDLAAQFPEFSAALGIFEKCSAALEFELGLRALLDAIERRSPF